MLSITLKQLELFISVAETKSFSKTADLLAFSQPAVSSNISLLEEILHTELLDRTNKKKIEITEDGLLFYEKAKRNSFQLLYIARYVLEPPGFKYSFNRCTQYSCAIYGNRCYELLSQST